MMQQPEVDAEEERIKKQTEEKRKTNINKCMGGHNHSHGDNHEHQDQGITCQKCKELVIMCLMDILLFLFLCSQEFNDSSHL